MLSAKLMGALSVIAIDINENRLKVAEKEGLADITLNPKKNNIEEEIKKLTNNIGVDSVIEAAGTKDTFEMAWKIARPNAIVGIVAMYDRNMILPLPDMYGKNLTFKTGGVDGCRCGEILELIARGKIDTTPLITHTVKLEDIEAGYALFEERRDHVIKVAVEP